MEGTVPKAERDSKSNEAVFHSQGAHQENPHEKASGYSEWKNSHWKNYVICTLSSQRNWNKLFYVHTTSET